MTLSRSKSAITNCIRGNRCGNGNSVETEHTQFMFQMMLRAPAVKCFENGHRSSVAFRKLGAELRATRPLDKSEWEKTIQNAALRKLYKRLLQSRAYKHTRGQTPYIRIVKALGTRFACDEAGIDEFRNMFEG